MTVLVESSRPKLQIISNHIAKSKSSIGAKCKLGPRPPRKNINWFHPLLWVQIEAACRAVGWPFSPAEIKRHLMDTNPQQFEVIHQQRFSEWIDRTQDSHLHFTKFVQDKIGTACRAMEPGGHNSRIGILVSGLHVCHGLSNCSLSQNTRQPWSLLSST